jgi:histidine triad (HIT) family protein
MKTIFEKIIAREIPSQIVFENDQVIAIKDIYPKAPVHLLIISKKVIPTFQDLKEEDFPLLGEIAGVAQSLAKEFGVDKNGYRLLVNNGPYAGQTIFHLHFHLLGGHELGEMG